MSEVTDLLNQSEELEVVDAIRKAEAQTSGEIRVHIERSSAAPHLDRAKELFHLLKMDNTKLQNGVLIYLAAEDRQFVILGDKGIDAVVENDFWDCTKDAMSQHFRNGDFKQGLLAGIERAGERLQRYFPWENDDKDELSNEISKG